MINFSTFVGRRTPLLLGSPPSPIVMLASQTEHPATANCLPRGSREQQHLEPDSLCSQIIVNLVPTAILFLFAATFCAVWLAERRSWYLLHFAHAFLAFGLGMLVQTTRTPADFGLNTMLYGMLYVSGTLGFVTGVMVRSGRRPSRWFLTIWFAAVMGALGYFYYIDRNLIVRIHIVSFGLGGIIVSAAWIMRSLARGSATDRIIFWLVLVFGLHFFLRTLLTSELAAATSASGFLQSGFWTWVQFSASVFGVGMGLGLLLVIGLDVTARLRKERDTDPLTGALNRRGLQGRFQSLGAARHPLVLSVVACDIDHFKSINDAYGHAAGDAVLIAIAASIRSAVRSNDAVGRVGGEEFVILLKDTTAEQAFHFAERLRGEIARISFPRLPPDRTVTCSFGIAELRRGETLAHAIGRADQALYAAKNAGRNRTRTATPLVPARS